jgi:DNA-binding PadR family transcriptional regulator
MSPSSHPPLTDLAFNVLVALKARPMHGYALLKELRSLTGRARLRTGTVYAALARLQDEGLVAGADEGRASQAEDGRRRYYRLTDLGLAAARAEARRLREVLAMARARDLLDADGS